jgi:hypothetical protein
VARHYVVAYPRLSERDHAWIQDYRAKHDPRYFKLIAPHVTLVFGIADLGAEELVREVRARAAGVPAFDFELAVATLNRDSSGDYYHEFLVPEKGYAGIIRLHDRLYGGALARYLRLDIDFIPHVGIGNDTDPQACKRRVDALNAAGIAIPGRIEALDVIELLDDSVRTVERIPLQG